LEPLLRRAIGIPKRRWPIPANSRPDAATFNFSGKSPRTCSDLPVTPTIRSIAAMAGERNVIAAAAIFGEEFG
jgi:hypothetical protein